MTDQVKRLTKGIKLASEADAVALAEWMKGKKKRGVFPVLVISGWPGSGKTTLARRIMQEMGEKPVSYRCPNSMMGIDRVIEVAAMRGGVALFDDWGWDVGYLPILSSCEPRLIRKLGSQDLVQVENDLRVIVAGNDLRVSEDAERRVIRVCLKGKKLT